MAGSDSNKGLPKESGEVMQMVLLKLRTIVFIVILILCNAGCSQDDGEGTSPGATRDQTGIIQDKITEFQAGFGDAVASFDSDAMLANFDTRNPDTDKILAIAEGTCEPYQKTYQTLKGELASVVADQSKWHIEHHYNLSLNLKSLSFFIDSSTHGSGVQKFAVRESADEIAEFVSDSGTITWEVQCITGEWKIIKMTICYDAYPAEKSVMLKNIVGRNAFHFGRISWIN